jgi:hypothetical protein
MVDHNFSADIFLHKIERGKLAGTIPDLFSDHFLDSGAGGDLGDFYYPIFSNREHTG